MSVFEIIEILGWRDVLLDLAIITADIALVAYLAARGLWEPDADTSRFKDTKS